MRSSKLWTLSILVMSGLTGLVACNSQFAAVPLPNKNLTLEEAKALARKPSPQVVRGNEALLTEYFKSLNYAGACAMGQKFQKEFLGANAVVREPQLEGQTSGNYLAIELQVMFKGDSAPHTFSWITLSPDYGHMTKLISEKNGPLRAALLLMKTNSGSDLYAVIVRDPKPPVADSTGVESVSPMAEEIGLIFRPTSDNPADPSAANYMLYYSSNGGSRLTLEEAQKVNSATTPPAPAAGSPPPPPSSTSTVGPTDVGPEALGMQPQDRQPVQPAPARQDNYPEAW